MTGFILGIAAAMAGDGAFDHTHAQFAAVLKGAVTDTGVDYAVLKAHRASLDSYLELVKGADLAGWSNAEKLALYVNAYNAYTIALMLDTGPPASIRDLDGGKVWDTRKFLVAGQPMTLNDMENGHARKLSDGRVHGVLNCASKGCPPLAPAPLTATDQSRQLDEGAKRWVRTNAMKIEGQTVKLSMIFDWYGDDFAKENQGDLGGVDGKAENALWFLQKYTDVSTKEKLVSGALTAAWLDYDWSLNKR